MGARVCTGSSPGGWQRGGSGSGGTEAKGAHLTAARWLAWIPPQIASWRWQRRGRGVCRLKGRRSCEPERTGLSHALLVPPAWSPWVMGGAGSEGEGLLHRCANVEWAVSTPESGDLRLTASN